MPSTPPSRSPLGSPRTPRHQIRRSGQGTVDARNLKRERAAMARHDVCAEKFHMHIEKCQMELEDREWERRQLDRELGLTG